MSSAKRARYEIESRLKCEHCRHVNESSEEMVVLTDDRLISFCADDTPQHRITRFAIHDSDLRYCWFDSKPIEDGNQLYLCGYVTPIVAESDTEDGNGIDLPVQMIGPLQEWWFAGFDGGQHMIIGVESEFASYILCKPHPRYRQLFETRTQKLYLTKLVIESLLKNPESSYQDLVQVIEESDRGFSQELLLSLGPFVIQQIDSFDSVAEPDEPLINETAAYKTLVQLSGSKKKSRKGVSHIRPIARQDIRNHKNSDTLTCCTPLVKEFFKFIFDEVIECQTKDSKASKSKVLSKKKSSSERIYELMLKTSWVGQPVYEDKYARTQYYSGLRINDTLYSLGDFVAIKEHDWTKLGRIMFMFGTADKQKLCHIHYFCYGKETVLAETAPDFLVYMSTRCGEISVEQILNKVNLSLTTNKDNYLEVPSEGYLCTKLYEESCGRFEDLPPETFDADLRCISCLIEKKRNTNEVPRLEDEFDDLNDTDRKKYKRIVYCNQTYSVGDTVLIASDELDIPYFDYNDFLPEDKQSEDYDEDLYPELYRKQFTDYVKGLNTDLPKIFSIGSICEITKHISDTEEETKLLVNLFYRPHNVFEKYEDFHCCDLNLVFWSNRRVIVGFQCLRSHCRLIYSEQSPQTDFYVKTNLFYFNKTYDFEQKIISEVHQEIKEQFLTEDTSKNNKKITEKLNILDIFAGCGGLSYGFHKLGLVDKLWAIEKDESALKSFKANFSDAHVFKEDVNHFLDLVLKGHENHPNGERMPQKGEIDLILGGPPCQGFSGMNRFGDRMHSLFKNSLIVSFLSFVDYYRPKYFIFENVRHFSILKSSIFLKLVLSCLTRMDYQCQFAILQAGSYGVPQSRRRIFIMGAAPGNTLPNFPEPTHVFSKRQCQLTVTISGRKFSSVRQTSAQFRTITVDDAINDLPELGDDYSSDVTRNYRLSDMTHYQKVMRRDCDNYVRDHFCKVSDELCRLRIQNIPLKPGSDWRDLPNINLCLSDGTVVEKLQYLYEDSKNGRSKSGRLRGVCICAQGLQCEKNECHQERTLIPWCLVHKANEQYQWSGLIGRLALRGYFPTTVTNPEPTSKQGRVVHPTQHRIVSIRESARSQGFPDSFVFAGSVADKYRQIGNAVPVPLSVALSRQFRTALLITTGRPSDEGSKVEVKIV